METGRETMSAFEIGRFRAMGTEVEVLSSPRPESGTIERVAGFFETVEAHLSRFRDDSELSRLNASAGRAFRASPLLLEVLGAALAAARESGGYFDPTVLDAMEANGYRNSFDEMGGAAISRGTPRTGNHRRVEITPGGDIVMVGSVRVDLGGFAKGWAVDKAALLMGGADSWLINAGGDLLARGDGPDGGGWVVGVEDPLSPGRDTGVLLVSDGAVATSTTMRRRWRTDVGWAHHIIDPRTGMPSDTELASVTVMAPAVAEAEVLAKTVLLMGRQCGLDHLESRGRRGLLIGNDGSLYLAAGTEEVYVA